MRWFNEQRKISITAYRQREDKSPEFNLKSSAGKRHLLKAIEPHIIQRGEIVGVFE